MWDAYIKGFEAYLTLERSMSDNTIQAYRRDVVYLKDHLNQLGISMSPDAVQSEHIRSLLKAISDLELESATQARILSGIKSFYKYLLIEEVITKDPTELIEAPKLSRKLPDVLSVEEVETLFAAIDHSRQDGQRNRAILEVMYSCGLRVSETIGLTLSGMYLDVGYIRVIGKGNKERLVPIGDEAIKQVHLYKDHVRCHQPIASPQYSDHLFISRLGKPLSRIMIFYIIRDLALKAGIKKTIHPHTLRHSFATHLVQGGADLRAVQDMMGHASITTTEIYSHLDKAYLRSVLQQYHPFYK